jgi:hypothetical protein
VTPKTEPISAQSGGEVHARTLRTSTLLVERTNDSSNVIGGMLKLSYRPTSKGQHPPKYLYGNTYCDIWCQEFVHNICGNPNFPRVDKLFFLNLHKF